MGKKDLEDKKTDSENSANLDGKGSNLAHLLDNAYVVISLDGKIQEANKSAEHLLGLAKSALIGHNFFNRWVVKNMGSAMVDQIISDRLVRGYVTDMKKANEDVFIASINAQLAMDNGNRVIECLITDISESRHKQEEFAETLRSVTGGIAHVINNQMASVVGTADLMKMELSDRPELAQKLDRISESGMQASDVAHNLVRYADTSENMVLDEVRIDEVVEEVRTYYKTKVFPKKPRKLFVQIAPDIHRIFANKESLVLMLKHLLDNAIDATEDNDGIRISSKNVVLLHKDTGLNRKYVVLAVEDHGHGMKEEVQKKIFDPFFSTRFTGRGMSLPQVLKTVKRHNGQIRVKTGVGKGSVFKVYLPEIT